MSWVTSVLHQDGTAVDDAAVIAGTAAARARATETVWAMGRGRVPRVVAESCSRRSNLLSRGEREHHDETEGGFSQQ